MDDLWKCSDSMISTISFGIRDCFKKFDIFSRPKRRLCLHKHDWIHWVTKSCITTAYRWLSLDSLPSIRILYSVVIKSRNFSTRNRGSSVRLLRRTFINLILITRRNFDLSESEWRHSDSSFLSFSTGCSNFDILTTVWGFRWFLYVRDRGFLHQARTLFTESISDSSSSTHWSWIFRIHCQTNTTHPILMILEMIESNFSVTRIFENSLWHLSNAQHFCHVSWIIELKTVFYDMQCEHECHKW